MVAGSAAPEMRRLVALEADRGKPCATALGRAVRPAEDAAAYVNGTAGTWHDLDEGNLSTRTHAAIQIIPAALAEAKARNLSGARLLEACIFAYEASARLWRATQSRLAATPMNEEIRKKILALLNQHRIMTIATLRPEGWPQATTVGYVNEGLTLYFLCRLDS